MRSLWTMNPVSTASRAPSDAATSWVWAWPPSRSSASNRVDVVGALQQVGGGQAGDAGADDGDGGARRRRVRGGTGHAPASLPTAIRFGPGPDGSGEQAPAPVVARAAHPAGAGEEPAADVLDVLVQRVEGAEPALQLDEHLRVAHERDEEQAGVELARAGSTRR